MTVQQTPMSREVRVELVRRKLMAHHPGMEFILPPGTDRRDLADAIDQYYECREDYGIIMTPEEPTPTESMVTPERTEFRGDTEGIHREVHIGFVCVLISTMSVLGLLWAAWHLMGDAK